MSSRAIAILLSLPYFIIPQWESWYVPLIFWFGILIIGIPHGAVDHHIQLKDKAGNISKLIAFIGKYISLMGLFLLFWILAPIYAIAFFILISAYHFGMVDFGHPRNKLAKLFATIYGLALLGSIIFSDKVMVASILEMLQINDEVINGYLGSSSYIPYLLILLVGTIVAVKKTYKLWWTIALLFIGTEMPLLLTFGLYFSFQHALESSFEIKNHLNISIFKLAKLSMPFSVGAYFFGILTVLFISSENLTIETILPFVFLFLGMVTLPHVVYYSFEE